ncbi:MAG: ribose-phosphate pyrophosphokinase [Deltaproteobacteria bacterium]|nr:ribose-phosphate pyrophosphokinase [Deltaproteobacteria bacterium]MBU50085.1 ribose-phosphate pyrophosphokinase [Deltaproteobacteria bacterium]|tara:strand:- start:10101 stop:11045 length:945 start_codon:yes stop_codon:yes gene_type:complete
MRYGNLQIFSGSAHPELAENICRYLGTKPSSRDIIRFANENLMIQIKENVRGNDVFVIQPSCGAVSDGIIELLIMLDALRSASAGRITAVIPYFPYVRSDKKDRPRISIAARLMADLIQTAGADRVLTMDLHAPQIQGFFHIPMDQISARPILCQELERRNMDNTVLVASDVGEAKDVGAFARILGRPVAIIDKRRFADDDKAVPTHLVGDVAGMDAILVDDEIATGGTLVEACNFLLEHGANSVRAAATHPIFCGPAIERFKNSQIEEVIVTNTVPVPPEKQLDKITVLSVAELFAEAIRRIHHSESVGAMLN